ncbi:MAG: cytochrome c [Chloroflexi bacterium AL-W]|nr:cytochrome c [Chloroflexi bacterium AL-N1]NOK70375.1 cytochrome c [Chloroflexi bacterium AL-N10]NOK78053.1 cytochrome c [Chloroflexi bacterium AL-N5]NOK85152.1 cytochrome c [Chloroflexi bacterium AL-W]NOK92141.1 cytochrome c [Chloroflexi bacterium AL-N15]
MAQVFSPRANLLVKVSILGIFLTLAVLIGLWMFLSRSDYMKQVGEDYPIEQPVAFNHTLHVTSLGMNCQYCHNGVAESGYSNVPATETCMSCHSHIATDRDSLIPIRDSWANNTPVEWNKVTKVPDYVYFNHSIHVNKGVGCSTCHGNVGNMNVVYRQEPMYMSWCLNCHSNPELYVRPQEEIYNTSYEHPPNQLELGQQLVEQYGIELDNLTNCSICHR